MIRKIILALSLFIAVSASAQTKKITLEDGVLQQFRQFRADGMSGFQWIPNTDKYVYFTDSGRKLMMASATHQKATEIFTVDDLNKIMGVNFRGFFGIEFKDANTFVMTSSNKFFEYDIKTKTGKLASAITLEAENVTWSDDKTAVAYTEGNNLFAKKNNRIFDVTAEMNPGIVSGKSIARNEFGIDGGIFWSPKANLLAFYQKDETEVADYPLLDINETPGKLENIKYPMIGQKSEKPKVGIFNLASEKTVFISPRGAADDYLTNVSWTPDEKFILIAEVNRAQNHMHLNLYNANSGAFVRTLVEEKSDAWTEPEHAAFFPNPKSNNFVWTSEIDGFNNFYYYSIDGKLIKKLTSNKFMAREIIGANPAGTEFYFKATGPNPTNMLVYKVDLKGKQTLLTKDEGTHSVAISTDGNWVFDEFSNHSTPGKSLLWNKSGKATTLVESANKYKDYIIGTSEIKTIKAADGTTDLYTRLIKPSNFDASKKYPVLVYVYGGPHAQLITNSYLDGANLWMYWMAEQGYLVFTVDNRGSDNRGVAFESVIHARVGVNEIDDQMKGVDYLKSLPYVDGNRLAVHGWSFGGFMTTSLMLRKPDAFKVGVAGGPVTDWKYYEVMYGERYMDTPAENQKGFDEASTLNYVKDLKGKLLLIHGTSDDVVVMQQNFALIKKFVEAEKQIDFFAYPMHKHNVIGKDRVHLMRKVLDYVIDNNK
ncbi:MAG: S9 family peptidase [Flavobacterium sp.]|uniref:S9 family peptidase n=1 Tax=Flavobacterium sp. TaxID=239 RepID=UPI001205A25E|nr:S9 family peptidase [Flavobacterium sp.]RZJ66216.1 MAG: S9 family peptidase [Flavobacterium sp.]